MFGFRRERATGVGRAIERIMRIEGVVVPAIIHNGSYFFVNLPVYADGLGDAWQLLDRPLFDETLANGWVTTAVPDGEEILSTASALGLGILPSEPNRGESRCAGGREWIDFDFACNPPCACSVFTTCPLPPQTRLAVAVEAPQVQG